MSIIRRYSHNLSLKVGHLLIVPELKSTRRLSIQEQETTYHHILVHLAIFLDFCNTPKLARGALLTLKISAFLKFKKRRYTKMSVTEITNYIEQTLKQNMLPMFLSPRRLEIDFSQDSRVILSSLLRYSAICSRSVAVNPIMLQNLAYHFLKSRYMIQV